MTACDRIKFKVKRSKLTTFFSSLSHSLFVVMITHDTLYSLANTLGALAMCTIVVYHFIAVNAKYVTRSSAAAI
jgi:hypothetical protein